VAINALVLVGVLLEGHSCFVLELGGFGT
jgi:hypothetical protein